MSDNRVETHAMTIIIPYIVIVFGIIIFLGHFLEDSTRELHAVSAICGPVCKPGAKVKAEYNHANGYTCFCQEK